MFLVCSLAELLAPSAHAVLPRWVCRAASVGASELYAQIEKETAADRSASHDLLMSIFLDNDYSEAGVASTYLVKHFEKYTFLKLESSQLQRLLSAMDRVAVNPEESEFIWTESRKYFLSWATLMAMTFVTDVGNPNVSEALAVGRELISAFTAFALAHQVVAEFRSWLSEVQFFGRTRSPGFLRRFRLNQFPPNRQPRPASDLYWSEMIFPLEDQSHGQPITQADRFYVIRLHQADQEAKSFLIAVPRLAEK